MIKYVLNDHGNMFAVLDDGTTQYLSRGVGGIWHGVGVTGNPAVDPGATPSAGALGVVTAAMVEAAVTAAGGSLGAMMGSPQEIADMFNQAISALEPLAFSTRARLACLVAQCAQETDWFKTWSEYGGPSSSYAPYYGRGMIQLTWESNYRRFGQYLAGKGIIGDPEMFVNNPDAILNSPYPAYTAVFYFTQTSWNGATLADYCDSCGGTETGDWGMISRGINRGNVWASSPAYGEAIRNTATNAVLAVTPEPNSGSGGGGNLGERAVAFGMSVQHRFYYSQEANIRSDMMNTGGGDCSSFVVLCYTEGCGLSKEDMGGRSPWPGYTGTLKDVGTFINDTGNEADCLPGDWMCVTYSGYNATYDHVVLYVGNGQCLSHGGGQGPKLESWTWYVNNSSHRVVRGFR